ncbi:MAG TPA: response regulator [Chloroflexaceae bacterium]|nr:response regulator [Chloroflexaceae bacterium]
MASVLVVDDDPAITDMLARVLTHAGHTVQTASDGLAALRCLTNQLYDVLITDLTMPGLTGQELVRIVVKQRTARSVLVITGSAVDTETAALADEVLPKPFTMRQLSAALIAALEAS